MTLVLSFISRDYVVQVSDRRLTGSDGSLVSDTRNKGIVLEGNLSFAYSGLAMIGRTPTDLWLADVLASPSEGDWVSNVATCATEAFRNIHLGAHLKRQAFIAVGWINPGSGQLVPAGIQISNAVGPDGVWKAAAADRFESGLYLLSDSQEFWLLPPIGARITSVSGKETVRSLRKGLRRGMSAIGVAQLLASVIRREASANRLVSESVLCVVLPRQAEGSAMGLCSPLPGGHPNPKLPCCFLINPRGDLREWVLPGLVQDGWVLTDSAFIRGKNEDWSMIFKVRRQGNGDWKVRVEGPDGGFSIITSPGAAPRMVPD